MSLTIDPTITDLEEWATDLSMVDDWLFAMWGIVPGASSPATTGWPNEVWLFAV